MSLLPGPGLTSVTVSYCKGQRLEQAELDQLLLIKAVPFSTERTCRDISSHSLVPAPQGGEKNLLSMQQGAVGQV